MFHKIARPHTDAERSRKIESLEAMHVQNRKMQHSIGVITRFVLKSIAIEPRLVFRNLFHACFAEGRRTVPPVSSAIEFLRFMLQNQINC